MVKGSFYRWYIALALVVLFSHFYISQAVADICYFNSGVSLGFLPKVNNEAILLAGFVTIPVLLSIFKIFRLNSQHSEIGVILVLTGIAGFSNLLDRVIHNGVCDYLSISFGGSPLHFNLNDAVLSVNVLLIIYSLYKSNVNKG